MKDETLYCRMTPAMKRQLDQEAERRGESASSVVREALREYFERRAPAPLHETPTAYGTPYAVSSLAPAATAAEAAAAALVARGAAGLAPTPAVAAPSASASAPAAAGPPRRDGRPKPPVRAPK